MADQTDDIYHQMQMIGKIVEQHDFIIRAVTSELEALIKRMPDAEPKPEDALPGETRGATTAYRLPENFGTLLLTVKPDGGALIEIKNNAGAREKVHVNMKRGR